MKKKLLFGLCGALALGMLVPLAGCGSGFQKYENEVTAEEFVEEFEAVITTLGYDKEEGFQKDYTLKVKGTESGTETNTYKSEVVLTEKSEHKMEVTVEYDEDNKATHSKVVEKTSYKDSKATSSSESKEEAYAHMHGEDVYAFDPQSKMYYVYEASDIIDELDEYSFQAIYQQVSMLIGTLATNEDTTLYFDNDSVFTIVVESEELDEQNDIKTTTNVVYQFVLTEDVFTLTSKVTRIEEDNDEDAAYTSKTEHVMETSMNIQFKNVNLTKQDTAKYTKGN
ncbi:MAG: hypothetical protein IKC91_05775 [Clostridia bacterium]|nr:hypothetical protein [Clostridia bacterium]